jgi:hypothetical protein
MSLAVKTVAAPDLEQLAVLVQAEVAKGWKVIDTPGRVYHDGKPRDGVEWAQHLQRRILRARSR